MSTEQPPTQPASLQPQVVDEEVEGQRVDEEEGTFVTEPSKLIRIASMTRAMLEEVRGTPLDEAGRTRLLDIYRSSLDQLRDALSDDLKEELASIFHPLQGDTTSESELRIVQAQLVGWLEGLFHGIQASLFTQQAAMAAQLEEMRRRRALEATREGGITSGQYL
ncbi:MAG: DUF2587 domain-containing protein [Acidimicrobiia bacterium]|jgi:hypothetical protein